MEFEVLYCVTSS